LDIEFQNKSLIAPCGLNCGICMRYLREKNKCPGCRGDDTQKLVGCIRCKIKNCEFFKNENATYCFECPDFPCDKMEHIDNRYRNRYNTSLIENLEDIKNLGIKEFLKNEDAKWTCSKCGGTICVHKGYCSNCGQ
jgi:hypothetical protein